MSATPWFKARWFVVVLLGLFAWLQYRLWIGPGSWEEITRLRRHIESQQEANQELRERNRRLALEVKSLKTDLAKVEERARRELGLIKKGETFYLMVDKEQLEQDREKQSVPEDSYFSKRGKKLRTAEEPGLEEGAP